MMITAGQNKAGIITLFRWFRERLDSAVINAIQRSEHKAALLLTSGTRRIGVLIPVMQGYRFESDLSDACSLDGNEFPTQESALAALKIILSSSFSIRATPVAEME
ncbi:MAG: hypothetical protein ACKOC1_04795 [Hyphomicrobiales bacterium]